MTRDVAFLSAAQNADGGWGYALQQASVVEPTAAAACALRADLAGAQARQHALDWLRAAQRTDGGWGLNRSDEQSGWQTAWAMLALADQVTDEPGLARGLAWLMDVPILRARDEAMRADFKWNNGVDLSLRGWPWLPGQVTWVEPTALTMLALARRPMTPALAARLDEAVRCLQDRRCSNGGWNVGAPTILGASLPARIVPTAWATLALARVAPETLQAQDARVLRAEMHADDGSLGLAWGLLALDAIGQADHAARERLARRQAPDGSWDHNPYYTALASLALRQLEV